MTLELSPGAILPDDGAKGCLVGRVWLPGAPAGPSPVLVREDGVYDLSRVEPLRHALVERDRRADLRGEAREGVLTHQTQLDAGKARGRGDEAQRRLEEEGGDEDHVSHE